MRLFVWPYTYLLHVVQGTLLQTHLTAIQAEMKEFKLNMELSSEDLALRKEDMQRIMRVLMCTPGQIDKTSEAGRMMIDTDVMQQICTVDAQLTYLAVLVDELLGTLDKK